MVGIHSPSPLSTGKLWRATGGRSSSVTSTSLAACWIPLYVLDMVHRLQPSSHANSIAFMGVSQNMAEGPQRYIAMRRITRGSLLGII